MKLRSPFDKLAQVMHLGRFVDKVRYNAGEGLHPDYVVAFCNPHGVDGHFLAHFKLDEDEFIDAVVNQESDKGVVEWFNQQPGVSEESKSLWNQLAPNLGKPGYPMDRIFRITLKRMGWDKKGLISEKDGVFEAIVKDEGL